MLHHEKTISELMGCPLVKTDFQYFNFSNIQIVKQEGNYLFCKKLLAEIVLKYDRILKNATCNMIFLEMLIS